MSEQPKAAVHTFASLTPTTSYTTVFSAEALGFARRVLPGEAQAVADGLQSLVARAFLWTAVASEKGDDEVERALPDVKALVSLLSRCLTLRCVQPWLWPSWAFRLTAAGRDIRRRRDRVVAFARDLIADRRALLQRQREDGDDDDGASPGRRRTLLDILLEPGERLLLSDDEILDEVVIFLGAAVDTTAAALGWALKALSLEQGVQQRLLREVEEVLGEDGAAAGHITAEHLDRLEYTERVIKETLRLLPTAPMVSREVKQQTELGGHTLPAGTTLVINIVGAHRHPGHWPDPLRFDFDPDRFLPENSEGRHPYAFLPFSAGPRNCIGSRYAMMLMKTLLATLVRRFCVDPVAGEDYKEPADLPMTFGIASRMVGGLRVVLTPREGRAT